MSLGRGGRETGPNLEPQGRREVEGPTRCSNGPVTRPARQGSLPGVGSQSRPLDSSVVRRAVTCLRGVLCASLGGPALVAFPRGRRSFTTRVRTSRSSTAFPGCRCTTCGFMKRSNSFRRSHQHRPELDGPLATPDGPSSTLGQSVCSSDSGPLQALGRVSVVRTRRLGMGW